MPNLAGNNTIADFIRDREWFRAVEMKLPDLPSDNWRLVTDEHGRQGILYITLYHSESETRPTRIPNEAEALPRLAVLHRNLPTPKIGPFIAFAEISARPEGISLGHVSIWQLPATHDESISTYGVAELGEPLYQHPKRSGTSQTRAQEDD